MKSTAIKRMKSYSESAEGQEETQRRLRRRNPGEEEEEEEEATTAAAAAAEEDDGDEREGSGERHRHSRGRTDLGSSEATGTRPRMNFLRSTFVMASSPEFRDIVRWNKEGTAVEILNEEKFCNDVLPQFFRHRNMGSFIRQMNMYGFEKMELAEEDFARGLKHAFRHERFLRDKPDLLDTILRRVNVKRMANAEGDEHHAPRRAELASSSMRSANNIISTSSSSTLNTSKKTSAGTGGKSSSVIQQLDETAKQAETVVEELAVLRAQYDEMERKLKALVANNRQLERVNERLSHTVDELRGSQVAMNAQMRKIFNFLYTVTGGGASSSSGSLPQTALGDGGEGGEFLLENAPSSPLHLRRMESNMKRLNSIDPFDQGSSLVYLNSNGSIARGGGQGAFNALGERTGGGGGGGGATFTLLSDEGDEIREGNEDNPSKRTSSRLPPPQQSNNNNKSLTGDGNSTKMTRFNSLSSELMLPDPDEILDDPDVALEIPDRPDVEEHIKEVKDANLTAEYRNLARDINENISRGDTTLRKIASLTDGLDDMDLSTG